ncbi:hypothetical protein ASE04_09755 [Rhizobium sp. Root708]|uniref:hypothetical protein n=1 Tax=Rhizobium sp. Root708 TaxID=1736592 RepID=UPI0006F3C3D5|nr:hypothetical protein [Rhizobium sp. Root708]KRB51805.1 hypothetical protein ASE04_09755 [Rhizobium sp. Root708]
MTIHTDIENIERRLRLARIPLQRLFQEAGINGSTWTRWRAQKTSPRLNTWNDVTRAADELILKKAGEGARA